MIVVIHCLLAIWINAPPVLVESNTEPRHATAQDRGDETFNDSPQKDPHADGAWQGFR